MLVEVVKKENGESELGKRGVGTYLHAMKGKMSCTIQCLPNEEPFVGLTCLHYECIP